MGVWIFLYVFAVWGMLPFKVFENPSRWFNLTWAVWIISQIIILLVLYIVNQRRKKAGKSTMWFVPYIISSFTMLLISMYVPTAAGSLERRTIINYAGAAQAELKARFEAELPEMIKQFDSRYEVKVKVVQTEPDTKDDISQAESSAKREKAQNYYTNLIKIEAKTVAPYGYVSPDNVQKLYQEIYKKQRKIYDSSQSYERYETEWRKYRNDDYVDIGNKRDGILLQVECPGYSYTAESNSDLIRTGPDDYAYKITDEISGKVWYFENSRSNGMTDEEIEAARRRKAKEEAEAAEAQEKERERNRSNNSGKAKVYGGGLDAYDKGYEDVDIDGEYDEYRYEHDLDYALGVDDAMEDREEWY